jgi:PAS domain S-box-containing protein
MRLKTNKLSRLQLSGILLATILILIIMGIVYYIKEKQLTEDKQYNILESVAELKAEQISQWYRDRIAEATYYSSDLPVTHSQQGSGSNIQINYSLLNTLLLKVMQEHRYENIMLLDTNGKLLFSVMEFYQHDADAVKSAREVFKTGKITINDFYYCEMHRKVHFDILAPIYPHGRSTASKGNTLAIIVFRIDPDTYLYPLINNWPGNNKTAEIVIGRGDSNKVVLLNKFSDQPKLPLVFNASDNDFDFPIVQAVNGKKGRFMGVDYSGKKVLSDLRHVQGTPWSMVVKMNLAEIYSELYTKVAVVLATIILLILSLVATLTRLNNRQTERQLASMVSHLPGFVYRCKNDADWSTLYISEGCRYVTGYEAAEFLKHFDSMYNEIIVPEYRQYVFETTAAAISNGTFFEMEYPVLHKSGGQRWVHERGKGVCDPNGELLYIEGYVEDISVRREAKNLLISAKEKAEESDRLKTAFLANMSHEIRTPMNGILGFLELLKEPDLDAENKIEYLQLMNISGQRLLNTINDIIEISKIESGKLESKTSPVDLRQVFQFYIDFFKPEADLKSIDLHIGREIETDNALIIADKHKLDGILTNLVKNAIKFTKSGTIELNNALEGDNLLIWVKDSGKGIPAHRLNAIFERFIQAETTYARDHEGSGLGLAIVKAYVDTLGGTIWVESEEGKGSTFFVRIPYVKAENKPAAATTADAPSKLLHYDKTILVAEDDDISYTLMKKHLQVTGINIIRALNGNECVELVKSNPGICLVMMDVKMPEMDGYEATRIIRQFNRELPIIAQTAYALEGDRELALAAGCSNYVSKPITKETILQIIDKYVLVTSD